ncbi:TerD family protein [Streptomyces sp. NBC_00083]|uniref:TerD family protein n=1 Tax=Streptomyces sp. NBC_00083 TaxID=2975647 RepID=UPI00225A8B25|nr:TerD family protein [Streptomyces sp. NBC_00083]MCX5383096.1 TerD family protein [Streptomyces sp. NBC_00083]
MVKGANVSLSALSENADSVIVGLSWSSPSGEGDADVSVLLIGANGKVRDNADFFFYNNPAAADGTVQLLGAAPTENGSEDRIRLDLAGLPGDVDRVIVAASRHRRAHFGELENIRLVVTDGSGDGLLDFCIDGASTESAFVFGEVYRREGTWKFRAIGQGYDSGLAGLATDYGIEIDEDDDQDGEGEGGSHVAESSESPASVEPGRPGVGAVEIAAAVESGVSSTADGDAAGVAVGVAVEQAAPTPVPRTAVEVSVPVTVAVPAQRGAEPGTTEPPAAAPARRLRTAKKKVTLPKAPKDSLAENDGWHAARLFPASTLKSDRERETRATSVLLAVMTQVPEFGRRLIAAFGAPAGRMEAFTEVSLPHGDSPKRPDGVIRVERAGKLWTALVETKTNGNALKSEQIQAYMDIAARRGYEAVITLSNDVALEGSSLVEVKTDGRRKHKVALWHLSWAEVTHQAQLLIRHEGVRNEAHAWLLQELLHYLQHDNSGCHGFQNMGPAWVPVRNGIDEETLTPGDPRSVQVVESWERLIRQVCLRLGGELGAKVVPVQRAKRGTDPQSRRSELAHRLCVDGQLRAEIRVEGAPGVLGVVADLRMGRLRTSIEIPAPEQGYPLSWVKRLMRQLAEAPADLHVQTLLDGDGVGPRGTLEKLRPEPGDLLPKGPEAITGFRLSLVKSVGHTRGNAETGFIRGVDAAVDVFHSHVVTRLERPRATQRRTAAPGTPA